VTIGYSAVGSSASIAAFSAQHVDVGASDVPMTASEQAAATGGPVTQVPVALGGEGIAYNLSLPAGARVHLTGPILAAIYLGQITHWNDPAITALNPGLSLPAGTINVVHRSDGSGTTWITHFLDAWPPGSPARRSYQHRAGPVPGRGDRPARTDARCRAPDYEHRARRADP
jgi:phosphate transport system substrate-binding protein